MSFSRTPIGDRAFPAVPFQALGGPIDVKFGHQTLTLKLASNLAAKVVGDHLHSGLIQKGLVRVLTGVERGRVFTSECGVSNFNDLELFIYN